MNHDFLASIERPFRALRHRRNQRRWKVDRLADLAQPARGDPANPLPENRERLASTLTEDDRAYLSRIQERAGRLSSEHHSVGRSLADRLRTHAPHLTDTDIAQVSVQILCVAADARTQARREGIEPSAMYAMVLDTIACAALDLTQLERSDAL
jgi:hypothetical protein